MPDPENGLPKLDSIPEAPAGQEEITVIGNKVLESIRDWYTKEAPLYNIDPLIMNRVIGVCLAQYAAILAVDTLVTKEQFIKSAEILFNGAYAAAPKFG
jgi:hypothetical protein